MFDICYAGGRKEENESKLEGRSCAETEKGDAVNSENFQSLYSSSGHQRVYSWKLKSLRQKKEESNRK
jgi:hypothetical protein